MTRALAATILLLTAAAAVAEPPEHEAEPARPWVLGAKGAQVTAFEPGHGEERNETVTAFGGGAFVERTIVPGWLDVELSVVAATDERRTILPIDLLLKKAWEPAPSWSLYLGAGPTVSVDLEEDGTHAYPGGSFVAGAYFWLGERAGLDLEIDYALLAEHGVAQELQIAFGPIVRF